MMDVEIVFPLRDYLAITMIIPWLLLFAKTSDGPGIFADVSYVQRVNTAGGNAPSTAGLNVGDEARVPYTAEYYFYRDTSP